MIAILSRAEEISAAPDGVAFAAGAVLAASGVALAPIALALLRRLVPPDAVFFARWGFSHAFAVFLAGVLVLKVAGSFVPESVGVVGKLTLTIVALGAAVGLAAWFAQRLHPEGVRALGFERGRNARGMAAGALAYACALPALFGVSWMWPRIGQAIELKIEPQAVLVGILELDGGALAFAVVVAVVIVPLLEETLFRGFLQPLLVQNLHESGGVVATSLIFALLHGAAVFLPIFVLSLLLGVIQLRTRRVSAACAVHGLHNGLMLAILFLLPEWRETLP